MLNMMQPSFSVEVYDPPGSRLITAVGSWSFVVPKFRDWMRVECWGGGGGGAGSLWQRRDEPNGLVVYNGGHGGNTTCNQLGLTAGGGRAAITTTSWFKDMSLGTGGVASGGQTMVNGQNGFWALIGSSPMSDFGRGGRGGNGGAGGVPGNNNYQGHAPGNPGSQPGGGGGGARTDYYYYYSYGDDSGTLSAREWFTTPGGGGGAYCGSIYNRGNLPVSVESTITGTVGGAGAGAGGQHWGGWGAQGRVFIEWV